MSATHTPIKKILLVEDEAPLANVMGIELKNAGYTVTHVDNGKDAIAAAQKTPFDLILLDIVMPVMDGFECLGGIRTAKIDTPVMMLSNLSQDEEKNKAKKLGAIDYIVKSNTTLEEIIEKIKNV